MFIDANTSRQPLIEALTGSLDGIQFCIDRNIDPDFAETEVVRQLVVDFIQAGDECAAA